MSRTWNKTWQRNTIEEVHSKWAFCQGWGEEEVETIEIERWGIIFLQKYSVMKLQRSFPFCFQERRENHLIASQHALIREHLVSSNISRQMVFLKDVSKRFLTASWINIGNLHHHYICLFLPNWEVNIIMTYIINVSLNSLILRGLFTTKSHLSTDDYLFC